MKSKLLSIVATGLLLSASILTSCNEDTADNTDELVYSSTQVKSFNLKANSKVLSALDSVFFSIDLVNAQIFNADSLPFGTKVNKLVVELTTDVCSKVELNVPLKNGKDTIVNYLTNSTDSIDFSNGPVRLHLVSYDGKEERDYMIKVNVHQIVPDSLFWNSTAMRKLPTKFTTPTEQKTVSFDGKVVTLTSNGNGYNLALTENPYDDEWDINTVNFGFTPNVSTFAATANKLYILDSTGKLYSSTDGNAWTGCGETWYNIYGAFNDELLGVVNNNGKFELMTYPGGNTTEAPTDFPVDGTSQLCKLTSKWTSGSQIVMLGGRTASGEQTNAMWGYDGKQWVKLSATFPKAISNASMFDYKIASTDTLTWRTKELQVLIALGGEDTEGLNDKVYVSRNSGLDWKMGDDLVQLPKYITPRTGAQAIVVNNLATESRSASLLWIEYQSKALPRWWRVATESIGSRATAPITEWEVPYIYLFGGYNAYGNLYNEVWRGVINRLTFKPLQ